MKLKLWKWEIELRRESDDERKARLEKEFREFWETERRTERRTK